MMSRHMTRRGALLVALALWFGLSPTLALAAPTAPAAPTAQTQIYGDC